MPPAPGRPRRTLDLPRTRRARALLLTFAAALAVATVARLPFAWSSGNALNHVSGAWMALAEDLAHGTFYRPISDPALGWGGTRFFPLVFAMHGLLRAAGADLLAAGYALSLFAAALVLTGAFVLLRTLGLGRGPAAAFATVAFSAFATQHALTAVRGDLLPVALGALGLAAVASARTRGRLLLAAALFTVAFAAKPTALTAPAAACLWLLLARERREAVVLALAVIAGAVAVVGVTQALSSGRFLEILAATASGGAGVDDLLRAPVRVAQHFSIADPAAIALVGAGLATSLAALPARLRAVSAGRRDAGLLPVLWLVLALGGIVVVFASPGTGVNHLVELEVASAVALGAAVTARGSATRVALGLAPATAAVGLAVALGMGRADVESSRLGELREIAATLPPGPVISEDPLLPLLAGERPVVLDPWMLRLGADRDPELARPLLDRLRRGDVAAVVLFQDLGTAEADDWYARGNLGPEIVAEVRRSYELAARSGRYRVYLPRDRGTGEDPLATAPGATARTSPASTTAPASIPAAAAREPRAQVRR